SNLTASGGGDAGDVLGVADVTGGAVILKVLTNSDAGLIAVLYGDVVASRIGFDSFAQVQTSPAARWAGAARGAVGLDGERPPLDRSTEDGAATAALLILACTLPLQRNVMGRPGQVAAPACSRAGTFVLDWRVFPVPFRSAYAAPPFQSLSGRPHSHLYD